MCRQRTSRGFVSSSKSTRFILRPVVVRQLISSKVPDASRKRPTRNRIDEDPRPSACIPCPRNNPTETFRIMSHDVKPGKYPSLRFGFSAAANFIAYPRPKLKQERKDAPKSRGITSAESCLANNTTKTPQMYPITGK